MNNVQREHCVVTYHDVCVAYLFVSLMSKNTFVSEHIMVLVSSIYRDSLSPTAENLCQVTFSTKTCLATSCGIENVRKLIKKKFLAIDRT